MASLTWLELVLASASWRPVKLLTFQIREVEISAPIPVVIYFFWRETFFVVVNYLPEMSLSPLAQSLSLTPSVPPFRPVLLEFSSLPSPTHPHHVTLL